MRVLLALAWVGPVIFVMNIPFGYWRANTRRFSLQWILSIHVPVPFVVLLRLWAGIGWSLLYITPMVACFFAGQYAGGTIRRQMAAKGRACSSWLIGDLLRRAPASPETGEDQPAASAEAKGVRSPPSAGAGS